MKNPLPTNLERMVFLVNDSGYSYDEVYVLWTCVYTRPDSYLIVETVLHIAKTYRLPVRAALSVWSRGPVDFHLH